MMALFGKGELGLLGGGEGLRDDVGGARISCSARPLPADIYPASGLALAAAYHDIKIRLASLERENSSIKRKLQNYEFPMICDFEEKLQCCSCESTMKDSSAVQSDDSGLQQKISSLTQELQKSKEREERLEDVIQAYEKIHLEKSTVQRDLDKMTTLAEQHIERILSLESALRHRDTSLQKLSVQLCSKDTQQTPVPTSLDVPREGRGPTLQSSRSLDALSDLKLQRLEAELEGARHQAQGACQREKELRVDLQRLQQEVVQLQERQSQELASHCEHCDVEWIKKAGDEQVNLALAYTELTEELGRVCNLTLNQSQLLRRSTLETVPHLPHLPHLPHPLPPQHLSPQCSSSLSPDRLHPTPPLSPNDGPASYSYQPTSSRLRAKFQGRRSYSEVSDQSCVQRPLGRWVRDPVSTLPKPRSLLGEGPSYSQSNAQLRSSVGGGVRPASAHGAGGERRGERGGGSSLSSSPHHHTLDLGFPLTPEVRGFCSRDDPPEPTPLVTPPLVTPPQSSEDEEDVCSGVYLSSSSSPPRTLGCSSPRQQPLPPVFTSPRKQPHPSSFSAPEGRSVLSCHLPRYTEHAQSWPSINLWMESAENAVRSCPLCQLTFPTGYPDDALIKHIDSHLENSKI